MEKISNTKSDWYARWFGSSYYHILYKNRDVFEAKLFLDNLTKYLQLKKGCRILDLACGSGRHSIYLAGKGFEVTGIDLAVENIMKASPNANSQSVLLKKKSPCFLVHDMRKVLKRNYFDVVLNLFTSFGYFDSAKDDLKILKAVHSELSEGGIFVLDFMNVRKIISNLKTEEIKTVDNIKFEITRFMTNGFISKKIKVAGLPVFEEKVKALTLSDFKKYFDDTGFQIKDVFGNYDLSIFDENYSDRLIIIAIKRK